MWVLWHCVQPGAPIVMVLAGDMPLVRTVSLKRLLEDPKLYQHLDDAALKLDASLTELQTIMKDLTVFSDKIARHPEVLGVRGGTE